MREQWVHLGLLHLEDENLSFDFTENFDLQEYPLDFYDVYMPSLVYICAVLLQQSY